MAGAKLRGKDMLYKESDLLSSAMILIKLSNQLLIKNTISNKITKK